MSGYRKAICRTSSSELLRAWFERNHMYLVYDANKIYELIIDILGPATDTGQVGKAAWDTAKNGLRGAAKGGMIGVAADTVVGKLVGAIDSVFVDNYRWMTNAFYIDVYNGIPNALRTYEYRFVDWHLYNIGNNAAMSVDFFLWVRDDLENWVPQCALNESC